MLLRNMIIGIVSGMIWITPLSSWGQIDTPDVIPIEMHFSRFVLSIKTSPSFAAHPRAERWLKTIEKNLCWSGVFKLHESQNKYCHVSGDRLDLQLNVEIKKAGESPMLKLTVADTDGNDLFDQQAPLTQNRLRETDVMQMINQITEKITVQPGILGSTIAFTFKQPGYEKVIARINTHGQKLAAVSRNQSISLSPEWNVPGSKIVYTVVSSQGTSVILDDLKGKSSFLIQSKGGNTGGTWSRDGQNIILSFTKDNNTDLYEINLKTQELTRLTRNHRIDISPSLSPDGKNLLFASDRAGGQVEQIYRMYLPTKEISRLTFIGISNSDPAWSPDGSMISFTRTTARGNRIYVMDAFGENERPLIPNYPYPSEQPAWSPDGRQIIFSSKRGGDYKLYIVFLDGKELRRLTNGQISPEGYEEKSPSWTIRHF